MVRFWDASAVVPLCLAEAVSPTARELARGDPSLVVWWGTRTECLSALARRSREGQLDPLAQRRARGELANLWRQWLEVRPADALRATADRLLFVHPLRAADALQLAAALEWCEYQAADAGFASFDVRLREAASREGFVVLPEQL